MPDDNKERGQKPPEKPAPQRFLGDVTIEVGNWRNQNFVFAPTQAFLRGTWKRLNCLPQESGDSTHYLPEQIPGSRIRVDGRGGKCRIFDSLSLEESKPMFERLAKHEKLWRREDIRPHPEHLITSPSEDTVKTWLYEMHKLLVGAPIEVYREQRQGGPFAVVVAGEMPTIEEIIKLPGFIHNSLFDHDVSTREAALKKFKHANTEVAAVMTFH